MQVRDKLIRETAKQLGISIKDAERVIKAQCRLIKTTIKQKKPETVYLRKVGYFIPRVISQKIAARKKEFIKKIQESKVEPEEEPLEFK